MLNFNLKLFYLVLKKRWPLSELSKSYSFAFIEVKRPYTRQLKSCVGGQGQFQPKIDLDSKIILGQSVAQSFA